MVSLKAKNLQPCLEEDVDGVAGEAAVGQVQQGHLVSAGQEGGEGVVDRQGVALTLQLQNSFTSSSTSSSSSTSNSTISAMQ